MLILGALNWAVEWYHPEDGPVWEWHLPGNAMQAACEVTRA